jgi:hypothetical protein
MNICKPKLVLQVSLKTSDSKWVLSENIGKSYKYENSTISYKYL